MIIEEDYLSIKNLKIQNYFFWTKKKFLIDRILSPAFNNDYGLYRCFEIFSPIVNDQNDDIENC